MSPSGLGRVKSPAPEDHRFDLYRGGEYVMRRASLRQKAELLNINMLDLAIAILKYGRCLVGEFGAVPSEDWPA